MKKKLMTIWAVIIALVVIITIGNDRIYADEKVTATITATETTVGGETTVTVTFGGNKEKILVTDVWLTYDPTILQLVAPTGSTNGGGGKVNLVSDSGASSYTFTFKALKAGSSALTLTEQTMVGMETTEARGVTATGSVTVKGTANQSKNNNLSALTVSPGKLYPEFSKDVVSYSIVLDEFVDRLTISATPEDAKAKVAVKDSKMDPGDNVTLVTVTAENGDQKVYTIFTKVPGKKEEATKPAEELLVDIGSEVYSVITDLTEQMLPEGYEATEYTYKDTKIIVGKSLANSQIVFGLKNATDASAKMTFAIYDERTGNLSPLQVLVINGMNFTPVEDEKILNELEVPAGFVEGSHTVDNISYRVWVNEKDPNAEYVLFYCTNVYGYTGWYQYDVIEGTMQRAFLNGMVVEETTEAVTEPVTESVVETTADESSLQEEFDNYVKKSQLSIALLAILLLAVVIIMAVFVIRSFKDQKDDDDDDNSDEEIK